MLCIEINKGYVTADAERRKRQRTQEIKKDFIKTSPIQIIWKRQKCPYVLSI